MKPPKDLRSQFLLYMQQREIDKILKAEKDAKEAEERRLEVRTTLIFIIKLNFV